MSLHPVYFGFDKYAVAGETRSTLNEVVTAMEAIPELKIEVVGHTDSKGSDTYNMGLSRRRAEQVVEFLVQSGVDERKDHIIRAGGDRSCCPQYKSQRIRQSQRPRIKPEGGIPCAHSGYTQY